MEANIDFFLKEWVNNSVRLPTAIGCACAGFDAARDTFCILGGTQYNVPAPEYTYNLNTNSISFNSSLSFGFEIWGQTYTSFYSSQQ